MGTSETSTEDADEPQQQQQQQTQTFPIPAAQRVKRLGMDFYENTLGAPKYVVSTYVMLTLPKCLVR